MDEATCKIDGCPKGGKLRRGWCGMHYERWRKTGTTDEWVRPTYVRPPCSITGCDGDATGRGWCVKHYARWWRLGDPLGVAPPPTRIPPIDLLMRRVNKSAPPPPGRPELGACWEWTGKPTAQGYSSTTGEGRKRVTGHRASYEHFVGPIPDGLYVLHECDNRICVRPEHLHLGTAADNAAEMAARGRSTRGSRNRNAKLTEWDVRDIREIWANDTCTLSRGEIAAGYKVSPVTISETIRGDRWGWVEPLRS